MSCIQHTQPCKIPRCVRCLYKPSFSLLKQSTRVCSVFYRPSVSLVPSSSLALNQPGLRSPLQPVIGQMGTKGGRGWAQIDTGSEGAVERKGPDTRSPGKRTKDGNLSCTPATASPSCCLTPLFLLLLHSSLLLSLLLSPSSSVLILLSPSYYLFPLSLSLFLTLHIFPSCSFSLALSRVPLSPPFLSLLSSCSLCPLSLLLSHALDLAPFALSLDLSCRPPAVFLSLLPVSIFPDTLTPSYLAWQHY